MGLVNINWKPSDKELKSFGRSLVIGFGLIGLVIFFFFGHVNTSVALWTIGVLAVFFSYFLPKLAMVIYYPWMGVAMIMGTLISTLIVGFIYYGLLTPVGLFFKLTGRDPLSRKFDKEASTYWETVSTPKPNEVKSYEDQF